MRYVICGVLAAGLAGCSEQGSGGFVTIGGTRVNPVSGSVFEVIPRPGNESWAYWCGAGQYARFELGAADNAIVYVVGGAGQGVTADSPSAVQFSLLPPGKAQRASGRSSSWGPRLGAGTTVRDARSSCGRTRNDDD